MTSTEQLGWNIPAGVWHRFETHIAESEVAETFHLRKGIEAAMRQYIDQDGLLAEAEQLLKECTDLQALSSSREVDGTDRYRGQDTRQINIRVSTERKAAFKQFGTEHGVTAYGRLLAAALDTYIEGGRAQRILDDVRRLIAGEGEGTTRLVVNDEAKESPSGSADPAPTPDPDVVIEVANALGQSFTSDDVAAQLAEHVEGEGDPDEETVEAYTAAVVGRLDVEAHPDDEKDLYIPPEDLEDMTVYADLTREARVEELRRYVALDAAQARKEHHAVTYTDVQALFERHCADNKGPSHQYAYDLMADAANADGYSYQEGRDGMLQLRVAVPDTPSRIKEWLAEHPDVDLAGDGDDADGHLDAGPAAGWIDRAVEQLVDLPADVPDAVIDNKIARAQNPALLDAETVSDDALDAVTADDRAQVKARLGWDADDDTEAATAGETEADADLGRLDSAQPARADGGRPVEGD